MEGLGMKIVYGREVQPNEQNYTGDVVQMQNNHVRMLAWQGDVGNMSRMAAAMHQQGFKVDLPTGAAPCTTTAAGRLEARTRSKATSSTTPNPWSRGKTRFPKSKRSTTG